MNLLQWLYDAQVTIAGHVTVFHVDSCGLDHRTAFVVGRADDGSVLQAVIGVRADHTTGIPASTGVTITDDPASVSAFGAESWHRRGQSGAPPGRITSARIRGSRIQVCAFAQPVDDEDLPTTAPVEELHLDARCDQRDDDKAPVHGFPLHRRPATAHDLASAEG